MFRYVVTRIALILVVILALVLVQVTSDSWWASGVMLAFLVVLIFAPDENS